MPAVYGGSPWIVPDVGAAARLFPKVLIDCYQVAISVQAP
jgi:hypothetical protein